MELAWVTVSSQHFSRLREIFCSSTENHFSLPYWESIRFLKINVKSRSLICPALNSALHWQAPPHPCIPPSQAGSPLSQEPPFQSELASLALNMQLTSSYLWAFVALPTLPLFSSHPYLDPVHGSLPPSSPSFSRKLTLSSNNSCHLLDTHSMWGRVPDTVYVLSSFFAAVLQNRLRYNHFPL